LENQGRPDDAKPTRRTTDYERQERRTKQEAKLLNKRSIREKKNATGPRGVARRRESFG